MTSSDNAPAPNIPTCIEWKGDSFASSRPEQPPTLRVSVEILQHVHQRFGKKFSLPQTHTEIEAVADNGCQTCTAGPELMTKLKCPPTYLIRTNHRIVGITDTPLNIIGTAFLNISTGKKSSKQMIYISKNCRGLYLSQTAMKDLGIIGESFPNSQTAAAESEGNCNWPKRTGPPKRLTQMPFKPTPKNYQN